MAQMIIDKQKTEQQQLRSHSKSSGHDQHAAHNQNTSQGNFKSEMDQVMKSMESDMNSMKMTNNIDHDFAMMMIPHHQSAIDMSEAVIKSGKDQEIKQIAEKIKSDSQKEIGELKNWLQSHGK